ncbi:MAG: TerC family protein [Chloroflexi bacterium]|jgi:predicted tellurium resistance membrane protein TerC|nr:TerC family protein [Chloroflexota bacterium]MBT4003380.1 TerC family protein [Chloroflexota bacterium]MBT4305925.1 TerC family protein [Chloroflexota bacterium]MBT4533750.1 TerC family protein [Chloroflexota bacterium]MBT4681607.1 TerC family protein [Chloroflexota bacterium]
MDWITDPQIWLSLLTLVALEIVLGIDNIVFITILADKLPEKQRIKARQYGLGLAMGTRILLLLSLSWLVSLTDTLFVLFDFEISGRDIILILGGLFLLAKSTNEIHHNLEGESGKSSAKVQSTFISVITQILLLDIVFSLDSVITAVGMANEVWVMIVAVVVSVIIMMLSINSLSDFVSDHPSIKILALSFLLMIGLSLIAEGIELHIPKGYIYFSMGFSVFVEYLNIRARNKKTKPVDLRTPYSPTPEQDKG